MTLGLLGKKIGMTRILGEQGVVEPVTVVQAGPCVALQIKTKDKDGYDAVQLGFQDDKPHRSTLAMIGHAGKAGTGPKKYVKEIRLSDSCEVEKGQVLTVEQFSKKNIQYIDVIGTTKGKGFAGVMKRHGFGGMGASHGTERKHRSAGGIGAHAPRGTGRSVKKGKRMAGHFGYVSQTVGPLQLVKVDVEQDLLIIRGSIPGPCGSLVVVKEAKKLKKGVRR